MDVIRLVQRWANSIGPWYSLILDVWVRLYSPGAAALVNWGGLLAGLLSRDGVGGVLGSWSWSWANLTQLWLGLLLVFREAVVSQFLAPSAVCVDLHVSQR